MASAADFIETTSMSDNVKLKQFSSLLMLDNQEREAYHGFSFFLKILLLNLILLELYQLQNHIIFEFLL